MTIKKIAHTLFAYFLLTVFVYPASGQSPIAQTDLEIRGLSLEVELAQINLNVGSPGVVQTKFGGLTNEDAPIVEGLVAEGDLVGPGLSSPLTLRTAPGHALAIPALPVVGDYYLQNIRLTSDGKYLSPAVPSTVHVVVSKTLDTTVVVKQLTPEELRARGIIVDSRNFDVYEYTFTFYIDENTPVEIPYPVIIDRRTREVFPVVTETPYKLPTDANITPPRWTPPTTVTFDLGVESGELPPASTTTPGAPAPSRPSIPAALVIPSNLAVLHQFFGVAIVVTNGAPAGSEVILEEVGATIRTPNQLRVVKSEPSVGFGQAVPIEGPNGVNFLVAQAQGQAEWTVEGLSAGTYTVDVDVRATMKSPGQPDLTLKGTKSASMVIHDPRFSVTFSMPSSVFATTDPASDTNAFSAYTFITNMSQQQQTVVISSGLSPCGTPMPNVCLASGSGSPRTIELSPGEMETIEYRLKSNTNGSIFASSTSGNGGALSLGFVVRSGDNLNPSTLVMPWYARFLDQAFVNAQLELLGRGFAIATTPTTSSTSKYPRVIKTDVFRRAVDIARAGQRVFITTNDSNAESSREGTRFAYANLALDLLGARDGRRADGGSTNHANAIREWDELRRTELAGRNGAAALATQIESTFSPTDDAAAVFARFLDANIHRSDFVAAMVRGGNATIRFETTGGAVTSGVNDPGSHEYLRGVPYADIHGLDLPDASRAELGLVGSVPSEVTLVLHATGPFDFQLAYPGAPNGAPLVLSHHFGDMAEHTFRLRLVNGESSIDTQGGDATPITSGAELVPPPLEILAARQDLYLDDEGHKVSLLFNRPIEHDDVLGVFNGEIDFVNGDFVYNGDRPISAAALQEDGRTINLTFDHGLHVNVSERLNCSYSIEMIGSVLDPLSGLTVSSLNVPIPRIDNDRDAAIILGRVIDGDGSPITGADVVLWAGPPQYDKSNAKQENGSLGAFLFEYVPVDPGNFNLHGITPEEKSTSFAGSVRFAGQVYPLDLQFLGRGGARGFVRYADTGAPVEGARVVVSNRLFGGFRSDTTDATGFYEVSDLPVGTTTFIATDVDGNIVYATNQIAVPGQVVEQDLAIHRTAHPGLGTVRGVVRRSDDPSRTIAGAHVGVYSQGFGLVDGYTDAAGRFEFTNVPAGSVTVLAEEWTVAYQSASLDFELAADQIKDVALTLLVRGGGETFVSVSGYVTKSSSGSTPVAVPGALVLIDGLQVVSADETGFYVYDSVPQSFSARHIRAHDPVSERQGEVLLGTLQTGSNNVPIPINLDTGTGTGSIRVLVLDSTGAPVSSGECTVTAIGNGDLTPTTVPGTYDMNGVAVGRSIQFVAFSSASGGRLGDQYATAVAKVGFADQIVSITLRLPGQGNINASLVSDGLKQLGPVRMSYKVWDPVDQILVRRDRTPLSTEDPVGSGLAGYARFTKVPAGQSIDISADLAAQGNATATRRIDYEGQVLDVDLQLGNRASVSGRVLSYDGITPIAGASVRLVDGVQNSGWLTTGLDGSFSFADVPADTNFQVIAEWTNNGLFRTGRTTGRTPQYGGKIEDVVVTLLRRNDVRVRVVWGNQQLDAGGNLILDTTPGDITDNAPISRASLWLRELNFPQRSFGTQSSPLKADTEGYIVLPNVQEGPFRINAVDGDFSGYATGEVVAERTDDLVVYVPVGGDGWGVIEVSVLDPENGWAGVASAEVGLYRGGTAFDVASTDGAGHATFERVPAPGNYSVKAFSKALGRLGSTDVSLPENPGTPIVVDVLLEIRGTVHGVLTDAAANDAGVVGAHVDLNAGYRTRTTTGSGGAFVFDGIGEGSFSLDARDPLSNRRAQGSGQITRLVDDAEVDLQLPPWASIRVRAWLPDDAGQQSSTPAPLVRAEVRQLCYNVPSSNEPRCDELHSFEGNDLFFDRVLGGEYTVVVQELGGSNRSAKVSGVIAAGALVTRDITFDAYGSVKVRVVEDATGLPMRDVKVSVYSSGKSFVAYTDSTGIVTAPGMQVGKTASVHAVSLDGVLSGSATGIVTSVSTPFDVTIRLQSRATISGYVGAEAGGPSIGTAVTVGGTSTLTGGDGRFSIGGFLTGVNLQIDYFGPDGSRGASQPFTPAQPGDNEVPAVVLDSTRPRILGIVPDNGAVEVPLDGFVEVRFSEPISPAHLNTSSFRLTKNGSSSATAVAFSTRTEGADYIVRLTPSQGLASHQLYILTVSGGITDLSGHTVGQSRGSSFTTSDKSEPQIIAVRPDINRPVPVDSVIEVEFNEAIDTTDWTAGGSGSMTLSKLEGSPQVPVASVSGLVSLDEATGRILRFAPQSELELNGRYRLEISGVRDLQNNVLGTQTREFSTADDIDPIVSIVSPVTSEPLVSGLFYTTQLDLRNADAGTTPATDIDKVEYFQQIDGGPWQFARLVSRSASNPGFTYGFSAPQTATSFGLRVVATDTSSRVSAAFEAIYQVVPDTAPANVAITTTVDGNTVADAYPGKTITAFLAFDESGLSAAYQMSAVAAKDGSTLFSAAPKSGELVRAQGDAWPEVTYTFNLPKTLPGDAIVTISATVTDSSNLAGSGEALVSVTPDSGAPSVTVVSEPLPDAQITDGGTVHVRATANDSEVGVSAMRAILGSRTEDLTRIGSSDEFEGDIVAPDVSGNDPVALDLEVEAEDYAGNVSPRELVPISVTPVYDPTAPVISFVCGTDGAVLPIGVSVDVTVEVVPGAGAGSDPNNAVSAVVFTINGEERLLDPSATKRYTTDISTVGMADGELISISVEARTSGSGSALRSWTIPVVAATNLTGQTIEPDDPRYKDQSIYVKGGTLMLKGQHSFANVIVLRSETETVSKITTEPSSRLVLSTGTVFVECGAVIDADLLGAVATPKDHRAGSYGGLGADSVPEIRDVYGSLVWPRDLGNAGGVNPSYPQGRQNNGGGAVELIAAQVVLDGTISSNGDGSSVDGKGGSGGSILIRANAFDAGRDYEMNARGGKGGGGGRIAIHSLSPIEGDFSRINAQGQGSTSSTPGSNRGSAGTIYIREGDVETLIVDNKGVLSTLVPSVPFMDSATVISSTWPELTLSVSVPQWVDGSRIECTSGNEMLGDWRVKTRVDSSRVTLEGTELGTSLVGASCHGYWRFDRVVSRDGGRYTLGDVRVTRFEGSNNAWIQVGDIRSDHLQVAGVVRSTGGVLASTITVENGGRLEPSSRVEAGSLTVASGGVLSHMSTPESGLDWPMLDLVISGSIQIEGDIDVSGKGFRGSVSAWGRTWPNSTSGGSYLGVGGSHGGRASAASGQTFGSVAYPAEPGAAGSTARNSGGQIQSCSGETCSAGGGRVSIDAPQVTVNGRILSNGTAGYQQGGGSGGSIAIRTGRLDGSGMIEANGAGSTYGGTTHGAGGRVAIESPSILVSNIHASQGGDGAGAGTVVRRSGSGSFGALEVDNLNKTPTHATALPSLGSGVAQESSAGATLVTDRNVIEPYFVGHWIEVRNPAGAIKGLWQVTQIEGSSLVLANGADVAAHDLWQGVYRFDSVALKGSAKLWSVDPILAPEFDRPEVSLSPSSIDVTGGAAISATVGMSDARGLTSVTLRATGDVDATESTQTRAVTGTQTTEVFQVTSAPVTATGTFTVWAEAADEIGSVSTSLPVTVVVTPDTVLPAINAVTFTPDRTPYLPGETVVIAVDATDNVRVAEVSITLDGETTLTDSVAPFVFNWVTPADALSPLSLVVVAKDPSGGEASTTPRIVEIASDITIGDVVANVPITAAQVNNDSRFRVRRAYVEAQHMVVTSAWSGEPNSIGNSDKVVVMDLSNPLQPIYRQTLRAYGDVQDVEIDDGWAYVSGYYGLRLLNLNETSIQLRSPDKEPGGGAGALAVDGNLAFVASRGWNNGWIVIFDVTNPAAAKNLRDVETEPGVIYSDLIVLNDRYLIGITPSRPGGVDKDVLIIDRADVNNLHVVATLGVPGVDLRKGRVVGDLLYAVDVLGNPGRLAIVNIADPLNPRLESLTSTPSIARSVDAAGSSSFIPSGESGNLVLGDVSSPSAPEWSGVQPLGGNVWDVNLEGDVAYVANEDRILVLGAVDAPPVIADALLSMSSDGSFTTVTGAPDCVRGHAPLSVSLRTSSGHLVFGIGVAGDGGFTEGIPTAPGETVEVRATDGEGRTTEWVIVGTVPFSDSQFDIEITKAQATSDTRFRARRVEVEGRHMVVSSALSGDPKHIGNSDRIIVMDLSDPLQPAYRQTLQGYGDSQDIEIYDGWAYVASWYDLRLLNLNESTVVVRTPDKAPSGGAAAVASDGTWAYASSRSWNNGRISIYDVTNPASATRVKETETQPGVFYTDLLVLDERYLVGITPSRPGGEEKDVLVIDRSDVNDLHVVSTLGIVGMDSRKGSLTGSLLYLSDVMGNSVAIVDLGDPLQPQLLAVRGMPYLARGLDASGLRALIADGTSSVTFMDVSDPANATTLGSEEINGTAWDVAIQGDVAYIANERGVVVLDGIGTPPTLAPALITLSRDVETATVTGVAHSVRGRDAITVEVMTSGGTSLDAIPVQNDGSFEASIAAFSSEGVAVRATDGEGRSSEWLVLASPEQP